MSALPFVPAPLKPRLTEIVRVRMSPEDLARLTALAERNRRSISNQILLAVLRMLDEAGE